MNTRTVVAGAAAVAVVASVIVALTSFDAEKVSCDGISEARASLQALYENGVEASVAVYREERTNAEELLSQCLHAKPVDPCADAQAARDAAVVNFNSIVSPPDSAAYTEFQIYFAKRDEAYAKYKNAKSALEACRQANPPPQEVPYEQSDSKACFDAYEARMSSAQTTFGNDTQAMRTALSKALADLDAREKACNPPQGGKQFTSLPSSGDVGDASLLPVEIQNCRLLDADTDFELMSLRKRAAAIPGEIQVIQTGIDNARKRMSPFEVALNDVDTYIPPESTRTQFEGALNALRAERKVSLEATVGYYRSLIERREAEKATLESELRDIEAKIAARLEQIRKENEARERNFPTSLHLAKPEKGGCDYYHCHGMLCGSPDPLPNACGHGATAETDVDCSQFFEAYLNASGV